MKKVEMEKETLSQEDLEFIGDQKYGATYRSWLYVERDVNTALWLSLPTQHPSYRHFLSEL
jgi:hypothetical protein